MLCVDWMGDMCLYTLPLPVWPYRSKIADASPENGRTFPPPTLPGKDVDGHFTCCKLLVKNSN